MTEGKPFGLMARFAVPMALANALNLAYTLADGAVLGRLLGVDAFAAVGATASLYWLVLSFAIGVAQGFGVLFAQRFGAKDAPGLRKAFATSALLAAGLGALVAGAGVAWSRLALAALNTPLELMGGASLYIGWLLGGMPVTFANLLAGAMLRSLGDSKTPLRAMAFSTALNIALDVALAVPFGIAGVAAATLLSQLAACAYCARSLRGLGGARFTRRDLCSDSAKALLRLALPIGARNAVIEAGGLAVQAYVNAYGADFVTGVAAAKRMYSFMLAAGSAFEASVATFVAQNFGAGRIARVRRGVSVGLWTMLAASAVVAAATLLFGRAAISLLIEGEPARIAVVLDYGQRQLMALAAGLPALHVLFLFRSALQGVGDTRAPALSGFLELAGRLAAVLLLAPVVGIWGVYFADAAGWLLAAILLAASYAAASRSRLRP